ncbi:MAG: response regulator [Lachnospiraceae bacterium]|nr:response regulator [Lachnospiraceae bacterium]
MNLDLFFRNTVRMESACMVVLFFIISNYFFQRRKKTLQHTIFTLLIAASVFNLIADVLRVYFVNYAVRFSTLTWQDISERLYIFSLLLVLSFSVRYVIYIIDEENETMERKLFTEEGRSYVLIYFPLILGSICTFALPLSYEKYEGFNHVTGWALNVCYGVLVFYVFLCIFLLFRHRNDRNIGKGLAITMALVVALIIAVVENFYPLSRMMCLATTIMDLAIFFTIVNPDIRLMEKMRDEKERADDANRAKDDFLSQMSQEIRTPINAVLGLDEMILRESREDKTRYYASDIKSAGQALLSTINDILDYSKISDGKIELMDAGYDLMKMLSNLSLLTESRATEKGLDFVMDINPEIPRYLVGDELRIRQVVINLLTNAVKYTEKGRVELRMDFEEAGSDHIYLKIEVNDTGIGFSEEDKEKVLAPFEHVAGKEDQNAEGIGLGMSIVVNLLKLMGSQLRIESAPGMGSAFSFTVLQEIRKRTPIGKVHFEHFKSKVQNEEYRASFTAPNARILVVDDVPTNNLIIKGLLEPTQIVIDAVTSGKEALALLEQRKYDLCLFDHLMPEMDGVTLYKNMENLGNDLNRTTPVVIVTANAMAGSRAHYVELGFTDYLDKPIDGTELERTVRDYLPREKVIDAQI